MELFKKRVFNQGQVKKTWGADAVVQTTLSDGSIVNLDQTTGAYQESDGTWYDENGDPLSYYDPATGNYVEQSDSTNTVYNAGGTAIGVLNSDGTIGTLPAATAATSSNPAGQTVVVSAPASTSSGSSNWLTSLMNAASKIAGSSTPTPSSTLNAAYKPTVSTTDTTGLIVSVLVIGGVITAVVLILRKHHKKA